MAANTEEIKCLSPLIGLDLEADDFSIDIGGGRIRKFTAEEEKKFVGITKRTFKGHIGVGTMKSKEVELEIPYFNELSNTKYLYQHTETVPSSNNLGELLNAVEDSAKERQAQLLTALRLIKHNVVWCPVTFAVGPQEQAVTMSSPRKAFKHWTKFTKEELQEASQLVNLVKGIDKADRELLELASEHRGSILSLLFIITVLERCIMDGNKNEIAFRLQVITAMTLAKKYRFDGKEVFDKINKAYSLRSDFVHGGTVTGNMVGLYDDVYKYTTLILRSKLANPTMFQRAALPALFGWEDPSRSASQDTSMTESEVKK